MIEDIISNRILASAIWLGISLLAGLISMFCSDKARNNVADLAKSFFKRNILVPIISYVIYSTLVLFLLMYLEIIDITMLADTVILVVTWLGFTLFESYKTKGFQLFDKQLLTSTLGLTAFMTVYLNLSSFSLIAEMVIQAVMLILVLLQTTANHNKLPSVVAIINVIIFVIVCALLVNSTIAIVTTPEKIWLALYSILASLLTSVLLALYILPFAIFVQLESLMVRLKFLYKRSPLSLKIKCILILGLHFNPKYITRFGGKWQLGLDKDTSKEMRYCMKTFCAEIREKIKLEKARIVKLKKLSGVNGFDEDGLWLDRRGFDEVKKQLKSVHACQCGLKQSEKKQYSMDALVLWGLADKDIKLVVSAGKCKYYAWKQSPGNWFFGVGGTENHCDEWQFDGDSQPDTFPGEGDIRWNNITICEPSSEWAKDDGKIID